MSKGGAKQPTGVNSSVSGDPNSGAGPDGSTNPAVGSNPPGSPAGNPAGGMGNAAFGDTVGSWGIGTTTGTPLDFRGINQDYLAGGPQALNQRATDAAYGAQKGFLDPQWNQQGKDIEDQLSRQGIPVGSDAYNRAMTNFNNSKTQAYSAAADKAVGQGQTGANSMFNMALLGQQQNISQQQLGQRNPLQLLQMLYGTGTTGTA